MPPPTPPRGLLIVIEGLDRSGKSTQCQNLLSHINNSNNTSPPSSSARAILQKFPDRTTPTGTLINSYLTGQTNTDDHAIHLLFSANRWEARSAILSHLAAGTTVIVDRYSFSGAVYSAAKGNPELDLQWAWGMEVGLPMPDLVVFLDLELEVAERRGGYGEERYERVEMQRVVKRLFGVVLGRVREGGVDVRVVDAGESVEVVAGQVRECYEDVKERMRVRVERGQDVSVGKLRALSL